MRCSSADRIHPRDTEATRLSQTFRMSARVVLVLAAPLHAFGWLAAPLRPATPLQAPVRAARVSALAGAALAEEESVPLLRPPPRPPSALADWEVHKFGGASLATAELYMQCSDLLIDESRRRLEELPRPHTQCTTRTPQTPHAVRYRSTSQLRWVHC